MQNLSKVGLFVTNNIFLNVIWLLNLTLKHIDKFRLRQESIPSGNYMFKVRKISRAMYQIIFKVENKDTRATSGIFILNFEEISYFIVNIAEFEQVNVGWY